MTGIHYAPVIAAIVLAAWRRIASPHRVAALAIGVLAIGVLAIGFGPTSPTTCAITGISWTSGRWAASGGRMGFARSRRRRCWPLRSLRARRPIRTRSSNSRAGVADELRSMGARPTRVSAGSARCLPWSSWSPYWRPALASFDSGHWRSAILLSLSRSAWWSYPPPFRSPGGLALCRSSGGPDLLGARHRRPVETLDAVRRACRRIGTGQWRRCVRRQPRPNHARRLPSAWVPAGSPHSTRTC